MTGGIFGLLTYGLGALLMAAPVIAEASFSQLPYELLHPFQELTPWLVVLVGAGAAMGVAVARYRWRGAGLLSYFGLVSLIVGFLVYSVTVSIPQVPPGERWLSYLLLAAETGGLPLIVIFSFYSLDAATRRRWTRLAEVREWDPMLQPKLAFLVPVYNEPVELVQQTVAHLVRQDYPSDRFTVVVIDDSDDPEARRELKAFCERAGAQHVTREEREGFKAGALNHAIARLPPTYELVSVIDADYWVEPDYAKSIVGYFADPNISFVQTPQDYRNEDESFLTRQYKRAEAYFYHAIMPSRNEQNAIIFCGTMGMMRRSALEDVGGFAEDQICEDAEISVRLAAAGWDSLYVDESFGEGLMPAVFEAYKSQFHRWAFGNVKILFSRAKAILRSDMSRRQKVDFMVSNLHWFDGLFVTAIALALLYMGLGPVIGYDAVTHHQRELLLLTLVPIALFVDSIVRLHLVLRQADDVRVWDSLLVQGMWFSIKITNVAATLKYMLGFSTPFVRTPKGLGQDLSRSGALLRSIRLTTFETVMGIVLVAVAAVNATLVRPDPEAIGTAFLAGWLTLYGLFFLSAPTYAYLSYRTLEPAEFDGIPLQDAEPEDWVEFEVAPPPETVGMESTQEPGEPS
ncbi:hypothetical protein BRD56_12530 [Thermoplasmatales archaeon SW_10_69_26]|nr:MAG: hypothetical protein BRD56_12530 [Thermoplasmatales archaeon SW_10_69_26]